MKIEKILKHWDRKFLTADNQDVIVYVERQWRKEFALLPHRTISKKWIWLETIYRRVVWRYTGLTDEPFTEYGTLFDVIIHNERN